MTRKKIPRKMQFLLTSLFLTLFLKTSNVLSSSQCWRKSYTRDIKATLSDDCPDGYTKIGLLCYDSCKENYKNVLGTCWEQCKDGYTDSGVFCARYGTVI
jgi:hypothetical protein